MKGVRKMKLALNSFQRPFWAVEGSDVLRDAHVTRLMEFDVLYAPESTAKIEAKQVTQRV